MIGLVEPKFCRKLFFLLNVCLAKPVVSNWFCYSNKKSFSVELQLILRNEKLQNIWAMNNYWPVWNVFVLFWPKKNKNIQDSPIVVHCSDVFEFFIAQDQLRRKKFESVGDILIPWSWFLLVSTVVSISEHLCGLSLGQCRQKRRTGLEPMGLTLHEPKRAHAWVPGHQGATQSWCSEGAARGSTLLKSQSTGLPAKKWKIRSSKRHEIAVFCQKCA